METKEAASAEGESRGSASSAPLLTGDVAAFDFPVADFLQHNPPRKPIVIRSNTEPWEAFHTLVENKILSAPVREEGGAHIGILKVGDLMESVLYAIEERERQEAEFKKGQAEESKGGPGHQRNTSMIESPKPGPAKMPKQTSREFLELVCGHSRLSGDGGRVSTAYLSRQNQFVAVSPTDPFKNVLKALVTRGIHMVPVVDKGEVIACLSQSAVIPFLKKHEVQLAHLFGKTVKELRLGTSPVLSVKGKAPAIDAFKMMSANKVSGLAIVDQDGTLIGNISASDIKLFLDLPRPKTMQLPVQEFVNRIRRNAATATKTRIPVVTVPDSATLGKVIAKFAATKLHRVFVVGEDHTPRACISLRDILLALL